MAIPLKRTGDINSNFYKYCYSTQNSKDRRWSPGDFKSDAAGNLYQYIEVTSATAIQKNHVVAWATPASYHVKDVSCGQTQFSAGVVPCTITGTYYGWMMVRGTSELILGKDHIDIAAGDFLKLGGVAGKVVGAYTKDGLAAGVETNATRVWFARAIDTCATTNEAFTARVFFCK